MPSFNFEEAEKKTQAATTPSFNFEEAENKTKAAVFDFEAAERVGNRPTPQQIERQQGDALTPTEGYVPNRSVMQPYEGAGGAAFGAYRIQGKARQENIEARETTKPPKITFEELYKNDDYFNVIRDAQQAAGKPDIAKGQSREDYVKDFMDDRRFVELNTVFGALPELVKMRNLPAQQQQAIAAGRRVFEETAGVFEEGGQKGVRPYVDALKALITDPVNYVGFGSAKLATTATAQMGKKELSKRAVIGAGAAGETAAGVAADITQQRLEQETSKALGEEVPKFDATRTAVVATISALAGGAEGRTIANTPKQTSKLREYMDSRKPAAPTSPTSPPTAAEQALIDPLRDNMDSTVQEFVQREGRKVLDSLGPETAVTDAKIATDLSSAAVRVAMRVIETDDAFKLKPNEQVSTAIERVFANIETIDDAALEQAIRSVGMTPDQFSAANKVTVSEAARVMQQYSVASKMLTRLRQIDPEFSKRVDELYGTNDVTTGAFGTAMDAVRAVERESKVWITSGIDTTFRNVAGTTIGLTAKAAVNLMEGLVFSIGHGAKTAFNGGPVKEVMMKDVGDTFKDAFDTFFYLKNKGLSAEVTDKLLEANPTLRNKMLHALQETDNREISVIGRWANTLNTAQDAFFRRAIFTSSVEQQLRRMGIDLYDDVLAKDKLIPTTILSKAVDDSLKASFSYMPKPARADQRSFEKIMEGGGNTIVRAIEGTPFMSLAIPFPRFMANAMAFQYRYSPLGGAAGGSEMLDGYKLIQKGETEKGLKKLRDGQTKVAQGLVGTAALVAAYDYRMNNPETEWYNVKNDNGTTTDIRAIFPLAPYFAVADVLARNRQGLPAKTGEAVESVVGMKLPTGSTATALDQLVAAIDNEREVDKFATTAGKLTGDFVGRFTQPFITKQLYDYIDLMREEGSIARDPNVIEGEGTFTEAAKQRVMGRLPVLKEELPEAVPRLREGPVYKEGEFFNRIFGFRQEAIKTPAEQEVVKLGIDPFRVYGSPSGDRQYDRDFIENANKLVIPRVEGIIANPAYQKLDPVRKREVITEAIRDMTAIARDITKNQMMAKDLNKVYKMRFNRLTEGQRRIINEEYAKRNGMTLEEADDYEALDMYEAMLQTLRFAAGGLVRGAAKKLAGEAATTTRKSVADIVKERNAAKQTEEMLAPVPTEPVKPVVAPSKPVAEPVKAPAAAAPAKATEPVSSAYNFPNKAFTDEEYAAAEAQMLEELGQMAKNMKVTQPKEYANTLQSYTAVSKGIKYKDMPPSPYQLDNAADDAVEAADDVVESTYKDISPQDEPTPIVISDKAIRGSIKDVQKWEDRDDMLNQIKEVRSESFPTLRKLPQLKGVEDAVIGTVQGDFRFTKGREVNPTKDAAEFAKMARVAQTKLNNLREKYKDMPPVTLYHGSKNADKAKSLRETGFAGTRETKPVSAGQSELSVNIASFGKDPNLHFKTSSFGGANPERFVAVEIPYADYVFSRVNMPQTAYSEKNLNVIARAISGAPKHVRPLGLPRDGMFETEDSIVDFEKVTRNTGVLKLPDDEFIPKVETFKKDLSERQAKMIKLRDSADAYRKAKDLPTANVLYRDIRDYAKMLFSNAKITSTKTGLGQRFDVDVGNMPVRTETMREVAATLRKGGSKERADLLDKIADNIKIVDDYMGERTIQEKNKARQSLIRDIPKLNKGGLVSRRS